MIHFSLHLRQFRIKNLEFLIVSLRIWLVWPFKGQEVREVSPGDSRKWGPRSHTKVCKCHSSYLYWLRRIRIITLRTYSWCVSTYTFYQWVWSTRYWHTRILCCSCLESKTRMHEWKPFPPLPSHRLYIQSTNEYLLIFTSRDFFMNIIF